LVVGPALFLVDNLIHPEELGRGNEAEQLAAIAADADRWQIAHLIGFIGRIVICCSILGLAWLVRRTHPALGLADGGWARVPAVALLAVGSLAVAFEGVIASNAYFIVSSVLFPGRRRRRRARDPAGPRRLAAAQSSRTAAITIEASRQMTSSTIM
jgi:hypothetical protein